MQKSEIIITLGIIVAIIVVGAWIYKDYSSIRTSELVITIPKDEGTHYEISYEHIEDRRGRLLEPRLSKILTIPDDRTITIKVEGYLYPKELQMRGLTITTYNLTEGSEIYQKVSEYIYDVVIFKFDES